MSYHDPTSQASIIPAFNFSAKMVMITSLRGQNADSAQEKNGWCWVFQGRMELEQPESQEMWKSETSSGESRAGDLKSHQMFWTVLNIIKIYKTYIETTNWLHHVTSGYWAWGHGRSPSNPGLDGPGASIHEVAVEDKGRAGWRLARLGEPQGPPGVFGTEERMKKKQQRLGRCRVGSPGL